MECADRGYEFPNPRKQSCLRRKMLIFTLTDNLVKFDAALRIFFTPLFTGHNCSQSFHFSFHFFNVVSVKNYQCRKKTVLSAFWVIRSRS